MATKQTKKSAPKAKKVAAKTAAKYGYFDDAKKEYVLTTPATPIKWCNYVGTLNFGGIVDTTGGTLICKGDPALNRITKYIAQMPCSDLSVRGSDSHQDEEVGMPRGSFLHALDCRMRRPPYAGDDFRSDRIQHSPPGHPGDQHLRCR